MDLREEVAMAAYYLYERSGWVHGRDEEHWLEAERIVMGRLEQRVGEAVKETAVPGPSAKETAVPGPSAKEKRAIRRRAKPGAKARP